MQQNPNVERFASPAIKRANALLENQPIASLFPYESFDTETSLYFNKGSTGFALACEPLTGANSDTVRLLSSIIAESLPEGSTLQFLTLASPLLDNHFSAWQTQRQNASELHRTLASKRVEYLQQGRHTSLVKNNHYLLRDFKVVLSCSLPGHLTGMALDNFINFKEGLMTSLKSLGMPASAMQPDELLKLLDELVNPSRQKSYEQFSWNEKEPLATQVSTPETSMQVSADGLCFNEGEFDVRAFSVREYPKAWTAWAMADLIGDAFNDKLTIPCPFLLSFSLYKPSHEEMARRANLKNARATQQAASPIARFIPVVSKISSDWKYVLHQLEEGQKLVKGFFQIVTYAPKAQGDNAEFAVKSLFTAKGWKIVKDKYVSLQSWLATLPMVVNDAMVHDLEKFGRFKTLLSSNAANLAPIQGEWKGSVTPRMLLSGRRGQVFFWDPFDNNEGNYNVAVVGKSGTGKSVFMQELMVSILGSGGKVVVIDIGRSFEKTCHYLGGQFIEFKKDQKICINPFTHVKDIEDALKLLRPMFALMAAPSRKTDDYENALIEQALQATWKKHQNLSTVTHVSEWLAQHKDVRVRDLGTMLHPYTKEGVYAKYFEGPSTIDFSNDLVVLELEELKNMKDLQSIVLLTLMYQVTQMMYQGNREQPIACFIDEAWDLLRGESTGEFVEEGCRRARKYSGAFITGTQGVDDYYKTPAAKAAFENSDWVCLLGQKDESITQLKQSGRISMDAYMERVLRSIKTIHGQYAEVMIKGPGGFAVGRLILDPFSRVLFSSKGQEYAAVKAIVDSGLPMAKAIDHYLSKQGEYQ